MWNKYSSVKIPDFIQDMEEMMVEPEASGDSFDGDAFEGQVLCCEQRFCLS